MSERLTESTERPAHKSSRLRRLGRAGTYTACGAIAALPFSLPSALERAEVTDDVGALPATVNFAPGYTGVDFGVAGSLYSTELTRFSLGLNIKVDGPPDLLDAVNSQQPSKLIEPFANLYQDPTGAARGYVQALEKDLRHEFIKTEFAVGSALAVVGFLINSIGSELNPRRRKQLFAATFGGLGLISTLGGAQAYDQWKSENSVPDQAFAINDINGAELDSISADNALLAQIINRAAPIITEQKEREQANTREFIERACRTIDEQLDNGSFVPPAEGETMVLVLSDLHSNRAMIEVYKYLVERINERYGEDTIRLTLLVGDQTYGSATERGAVDALAEISDEMYAVIGNHDSELIEEAQEEAGIESLEGETVKTSSGITVLGIPDPNLTKLSAMFGFDKNTLRDSDITKEDAARRLAEEVESTNPTFVLSHEAYELEALLDMDISKSQMVEWFENSEPDPEISAKAVLYGHWHGDFTYRIVHNEAGEGTIVAEMPSAGGASSKMSLSTFSLPWTTPAKTAGAVLFTVSNESQLVTGVQEFSVTTEGSSEFKPKELISQPIDADFSNESAEQHQATNPEIDSPEVNSPPTR